MKQYFKDLATLCEQTGSFYKKHWLGAIILTIVGTGITIAVTWPKELKESVIGGFKDKFKKDSKEEEA